MPRAMLSRPRLEASQSWEFLPKLPSTGTVGRMVEMPIASRVHASVTCRSIVRPSLTSYIYAYAWNIMDVRPGGSVEFHSSCMYPLRCGKWVGPSRGSVGLDTRSVACQCLALQRRPWCRATCVCYILQRGATAGNRNRPLAPQPDAACSRIEVRLHSIRWNAR